MRRGTGALTAMIAAFAVIAAPASASKLVTWRVPSRYVDPAKVAFNGASHRDLRVNVLLPDGYDGKRRFPVLFLLHGHGDGYSSWAAPKNGNVRQVARGLRAVIVMPEGDRGWYTNWWNGGRRGGPAWERYHLDELVPAIERRARIMPGRRWHAIAGLSMGGEGALFYAAQRPGYFGSAASFSGSISIQRPEWPDGFDTQGERHLDVFGDPTAQRFYWTGHNPTALTANLRHTRVFVAVGDGVPGGSLDEIRNNFGQVAEADLHQHAEDFVGAARSSGVNVTYRPQQGIHDWPYWRRHLAQAIQWGLFGAVSPQPADWTYRTVAASGRMWDLAFSFRRAPATVETFTRHGRTLLGSGAGTVALRTYGGCRLAVALPFAVQLPTGCVRPRLRLKVRPRRTRVGRRVRFRFRVTTVRSGRRRPVAGVRIRFAGRRARTGRRGRARIVTRLRHARRYTARARKRGYRPAKARVRARRSRRHR
jgi:S-formylglutathione hydrolase FrmB